MLPTNLLTAYREMQDHANAHLAHHLQDNDFCDLWAIMEKQPDKFFWAINGDFGTLIDGDPLLPIAHDIAIRDEPSHCQPRRYFIYKQEKLRQVTHTQWRHEVTTQPWPRCTGPALPEIPDKFDIGYTLARRELYYLYDKQFMYYVEAHQEATRFYLFKKKYASETCYIAANDNPLSVRTARHYIDWTCLHDPEHCYVMYPDRCIELTKEIVLALLDEDQAKFTTKEQHHANSTETNHSRRYRHPVSRPQGNQMQAA